jgi:hypothetical protein
LPSLDAARAFARAAGRSTLLSPERWLAFQGEYLKSSSEQFFVRLRDGRVLLRSELEEAITASRSRRSSSRRKAA